MMKKYLLLLLSPMGLAGLAAPALARSTGNGPGVGDFLTKHEVFMVQRQLSFAECPVPGWRPQRPAYRETRFEERLRRRLFPALRTKLEVRMKLAIKTDLRWEPAESDEPFRLEIGLSPEMETSGGL